MDSWREAGLNALVRGPIGTDHPVQMTFGSHLVVIW